MNGPLARPLRVVRLVRRAAKLYDASAFAVARRALRLYRVEGVSPRRLRSGFSTRA